MITILRKSNLSFLIFLSALSLSTLSISLEYFLDMQPCLFCKLQRYVYVALLFPSFLSMTRESYINTQTARVMQILFTGGALLALYQFLMQQGIVSDFCAVPKVTSIEQFENLLNKKSCSEISWKFLGMPITFFNLIISLIFFALLQKHKKVKIENYGL